MAIGAQGLTVEPGGTEGARPRRGRLGAAVRLLGFVGGIALLAAMLHWIGWARVGEALARVGWSGFLLIAALGVAENICDALALRVVIGRGIALRRVFAYHGTGSLLNLLLPFDFGEVLKGAMLARDLGGRQAASATIVWNYIFKAARPTMALTAALVGLWLGGGVNAETDNLVLAAAALAFIPYLVLRLLIRFGMAEPLARFGRALRIFKRADHLVDWARRLDGEVRSFWRERPRDYLLAFAAQCAGRAAGCLSLVLALRLLGTSYGFALGLLVYAAVNVAEYATVVLPARIGVSEGAAWAAFRLLGLDPGIGLIAALLMRLKAIATNATAALLIVGTRGPVQAGKRER